MRNCSATRVHKNMPVTVIIANKCSYFEKGGELSLGLCRVYFGRRFGSRGGGGGRSGRGRVLDFVDETPLHPELPGGGGAPCSVVVSGSALGPLLGRKGRVRDEDSQLSLLFHGPFQGLLDVQPLAHDGRVQLSLESQQVHVGLEQERNCLPFLQLTPTFDKCHETSRIFPRIEQTFASASSFIVIS